MTTPRGLRRHKIVARMANGAPSARGAAHQCSFHKRLALGPDHKYADRILARGSRDCQAAAGAGSNLCRRIREASVSESYCESWVEVRRMSSLRTLREGIYRWVHHRAVGAVNRKIRADVAETPTILRQSPTKRGGGIGFRGENEAKRGSRT